MNWPFGEGTISRFPGAAGFGNQTDWDEIIHLLCATTEVYVNL